MTGNNKSVNSHRLVLTILLVIDQYILSHCKGLKYFTCLTVDTVNSQFVLLTSQFIVLLTARALSAHNIKIVIFPSDLSMNFIEKDFQFE